MNLFFHGIKSGRLIGLSIILSLFFLLFYLACNSEQPTALNSQNEINFLGKNKTTDETEYYNFSREQENILISDIAQGLAVLASNPKIRERIKEEIIQSPLVSQIIPLEYLLDCDVSMEKIIDRLYIQEAQKGSAKKKLESFKKNSNIGAIIKSHSLGIDAYFPVNEHREKIKNESNVKFLVAYFNGNEDDQVERQFPAWDHEGNQVTLTTAYPPDIPVLILTQCEHDGTCRSRDEKNKPWQETAESHDHIMNATSTATEGPLPTFTLYFNWYCIHEDHEPWTMGQPEIYFKTKLYRINGTQAVSNRKNHYFMREKCEFTDLKFLSSYASYDCLDIKYAFIEVMEDDPGDDDELEKYGGWRKNSGTGTWFLYNDPINVMYGIEWYGDDGDCDLRLICGYTSPLL